MARSKHSLEVKLQILHLLNEGEYSQSEICEKFSDSKKTIRRRKMKFDKAGVDGLIESTAWKTYSKELKINAVEDFLQKDLTGNDILEKYTISSDSILRTWVKKFEAAGEEGLRDLRGRKKEEVELTMEEKLQLEIKRIERENERLRAENLFLKKLEEIERRRR
jgi:transposase